MRVIREIYLATLSRRLNDKSDDFANPASHTEDISWNLLEACKLIKFKMIFCKTITYCEMQTMHSVKQTTVPLINKCVFANFLELLEIGLVKALHFNNLFVVIIDFLQN